MGLLLGSTVFAWNAIVDNFIRNHSDGFMLPRVIFAFLFYIITWLAAPEKDDDLTPEMWRLILLLTIVPVGSVLGVFCFPENGGNRETLICGCILLCFVCQSLRLWGCFGLSVF